VAWLRFGQVQQDEGEAVGVDHAAPAATVSRAASMIATTATG
jgi:hypothetical protein